MATLPSGLPDFVADEEDLARFLTQRSQWNFIGAKPALFLPNPKYRNTSIFRMGNEPGRLRQTWKETVTSDRTLKGAAICKARDVRAMQLDVIPEEPPPAHANIQGWPWNDSDPEEQKAKQIELAAQIASASEVVLL